MLVLCRWICTRAGITWPYTVWLRHANGRVGGRGWRNRQKTWYDCRFGKWPGTIRDTRWAHSPTQIINSRLEHLVFILAHEAAHATIGHPNKFFRKERIGHSKLRFDEEAMEFACNRFGMETVEALRKEWPARLRAQVYEACRADRRKRKDKSEQKRDPNLKLQRAQANLDRWLRRQKLVNTKIRRYKKAVIYYEGRVAAFGSASSGPAGP